MNNSIKLEIPLEAQTLITTATMLTGLAAVLKGEAVTVPGNDECAAIIEEVTTPPVPATNSEESLYTSPGTIDEQQAAIAAAKLKEITTPPAGVDLDSNDLPWDNRIHSAGKTKLVKDQTWKKKRNLDPALVLQVENELRQAMAAPAITTGTVTTAAEAFAESETPIPPLADTQVPPANVIPPPAANTTTPPPAANTEPLPFPIIMAKVTNAMALGTLTQETITAVCNKLGIASITLLSARPDLIDAVNAELFPNG